MALFMQRLGDVISPNSFSDNVLPTGALTLDNRPAFCTTGNFPSANFPRVAWITWSFDGDAGGPLTARVWSQTTFDNFGASFITNEANLMRVTAQGTGWAGTSATVKVSLSRFVASPALSISRTSSSRLVDLTVVRTR